MSDPASPNAAEPTPTGESEPEHVPETPEETAARRKAWGAEWSQISRKIKADHDAKEG